MRVFIKSFGCSANLADGEVLAGCLENAAYKLVDTVDAADIVLYNTCAVKGPTENRMIHILRQVPSNKKLIVAGCLPLINPERLRKETRFDGAVGPAAGEKIVEALDRVSNGERIEMLEDSVNAQPSLNLPRLRLNPAIGIIPVNYGCLGSCAYCCVVFARGRLRSYKHQEITERVKSDLASGARELWITSQDTASYGKDIGTNLANLLRTLSDIKGDFRIRVGMMTPNLAQKIVEDLIQSFKSEKVFKFIHIPVQSGDNNMLKSMRRLYSIEDFKETVNAFRTSFPKITVATDVICGFPGEADDDFHRTLQLVEEIQPDIVNVSKFFPRPKTEASRMLEKSVPNAEIKRRSGLIASLSRKIALEKNQRWVGWTGKILIDEIGKHPGLLVGRNFAYKPVAVRTNECRDQLGSFLKARVVEASVTHLVAEPV